MAEEMKPRLAGTQRRRDGMAEVVVHEVLDLGRSQLGLDVDRDAVFGGVVHDVDLVVGVAAAARHPVQRPSDDYSVPCDGHDVLASQTLTSARRRSNSGRR